MATQNLFEKYGIKEVADVTLFRIEKKEQTYESQRTITASSILKGALELREVFPVDETGTGSEDGFKAYVFTDAQIVTGTNYDCDDVRKIQFTVKLRLKNDSEANNNAQSIISNIKAQLDANADAIVGAIITNDDDFTGVPSSLKDMIEGYSFEAARDADTGIVLTETVLSDVATVTLVDGAAIKYEFDTSRTAEQIEYIDVTMTAPFETTLAVEGMDDTATGVYNDENAAEADARYTDRPGTHEYSYYQQICMLFARRQNLMAKTGVRYTFENSDTMFGNITFSTDFAAAAHSTEKVVVAGLEGKFDEGTYDLDEINEAINQLTDSITAKAYDVKYTDYAELVVNDEMGYYNPAFLGKNYMRTRGGNASITFFTNEEGNRYTDYTDKPDFAIARAKMWSDGVHYSINDAIDALRQKKLALDAGESDGREGINSIFGGYKVSSYVEDTTSPVPGTADNDEPENTYKYQVGTYDEETGTTTLSEIESKYTGENITSDYRLGEVIKAVSDIGATNEAFGKDLRVDANGKASNRAIYVKVDGMVDTAAGSYIYLLRNQNYKKLSLDKDGIFKFTDKTGNVLYYQDKIFTGIEYLALVIIGDKGLIFVVNRHGNKNVTRIGWMVSDNGYVTDTQANTLVTNGLIHTTDITVNNETFEATCTVGGLNTHKTVKMANRYVPVLYLDTLKVSTLEQTAEQTYATGGRGNANLIGWDFGKEITLSLQDALFTPASMSAIFGSEGSDFRKGVKETKSIDRMEKITAKRSFIVPAGNQNGTPTEADKTAQAVYYDPRTMEPFADGTPIAEGEVVLKYTRSVAYEGQSIGNTIEISADKFPGTYKVVGETYVRNKETGEDQRFQFVIPQAKMTSEQTITLEADGDPTVFDMNMTVLRPEDGVMVRLVQFDVVENEEENDGSTMVKDTENLNLLDDAELYKVSSIGAEDTEFIGATEY